MSVLDIRPGALLDLWEAVSHRCLPSRSLALLGATGGDSDCGDISRCRIGRRDALLMQLRERLFGPELSMVAQCPACQSDLEFSLDVPNLVLPATCTAE